MSDDSLSWLYSIIGTPLNGLDATFVSHTTPSPFLSFGSDSSENRHSSRPPTTTASSSLSTTPNPDEDRVGSNRSASSSKLVASPLARPLRRRIRPKIALDSTQPLTAQGKPRARVYVACDQCRVRKTRCDGAKPVCFNCRKRPPDVGECSYNVQPNRRGQDRVPGTRSRTSEKASKRQRNSKDDHHDREEHTNSDISDRSEGDGPSPSRLSSSDESAEGYDPFPLVDLDPPSTKTERYVPPREREERPSISSRPSLRFTRDTWWDALLTFYSADEGTTDIDVTRFSAEQRQFTVRRIVSDVRALFQSTIYWASFIHVPRFFEALLNPTRRQSMQPSLVLSALAVGVLSQSSEADQGAKGRAKALKLLNLADSSLQASLASGWVDIGLIQAAWLIVYFEIQAHPMQSADRNRSSLLLLDSLIRLFSLTTLDGDLKQTHDHPQLHTSSLNAASFATTFSASNQTTHHHDFISNPFSALNPDHLPERAASLRITEPIVSDNIMLDSFSTTPVPCSCANLALGNHWPHVHNIAPAWAGSPIWPEGLAEGEFRKEESRRLVWASVMITASMNSYTSVLEDIDKNRLWIKNPDNYMLLFPGQSLAMTGVPVQANDIWTLHLRAMLLLHGCVCKRGDLSLSDAERAQFAMQTWLELDEIEEALNTHTCGVENKLGFQAREIIFSARMCVSHEFQRYIPLITTNGSRLFYRDKAEEWLRRRMIAAEWVWRKLLAGIQTPALDHRKPLLIYWFMSHIIKALVLWKEDPTLLVALEASKTFAKRAEYLMMFWPSPKQRKEWQRLRYQIVEACIQCGIPPPDSTLPGLVPRIPTGSSPDSDCVCCSPGILNL